MSRSLLVLALGAVLAVGACSGSTSSPAASSAAPASAAAPSAAPASAAGGGSSAAADVLVGIRNFAFNPPTVTAAVGQNITWKNGDDVPHTVTWDDESITGSNGLNNGQSYTTSFSKAGTYAYHCKIHQSMKGSVTVS